MKTQFSIFSVFHELTGLTSSLSWTKRTFADQHTHSPLFIFPKKVVMPRFQEIVIGFYPHTLLVARKNQFLAKKLFGYLQVLCF